MAKRKAGKQRPEAEDQPLCAHGEPTGANGKSPGYEGPGHCAGCDDASQALADSFEESVAAGEVNEQGYSLSDWKKAGKDPAEWADAPPRWAIPDSANAAADPAPAEEPPVHLARCEREACDAAVRYRALPSRSGFSVIERYGVDVDQTFGIGTRGQPLCPFGHGEMQLADETLPVGEAMEQVAERLNGQAAAPTQAQLFEMAKPFNLDGAWAEIVGKRQEIRELAEEYKRDAATAREAKKSLDEANETLNLMIDRFEARRVAKEKELQDRADASAEADADVRLCGRITALGVPFDVASVAALTYRTVVESFVNGAEAHPDERETWMPLLLEAIGRPGEAREQSDDDTFDNEPEAQASDAATA